MPVIKGLDWLDIYGTNWRKRNMDHAERIPPYVSPPDDPIYGCHYYYSGMTAQHDISYRREVRYWIGQYAGSEAGEAFPALMPMGKYPVY